MFLKSFAGICACVCLCVCVLCVCVCVCVCVFCVEVGVGGRALLSGVQAVTIFEITFLGGGVEWGGLIRAARAKHNFCEGFAFLCL